MNSKDSSDEYRSLKVTRRAYDALQALRLELSNRGLNTLPEGVVTPDMRSEHNALSLSLVCEVGTRSALRLMRPEGSGQ